MEETLAKAERDEAIAETRRQLHESLERGFDAWRGDQRGVAEKHFRSVARKLVEMADVLSAVRSELTN